MRILVVDDHTLVREGSARMLSWERDIEIAGEAWDGKLAVEMTQELLPDIVLMDITKPVMDGIVRMLGQPGHSFRLQKGRVFRFKTATHSGANKPGIPVETSHRFRLKQPPRYRRISADGSRHRLACEAVHDPSASA